MKDCMDERLEQIKQWLRDDLSLQFSTIEPASSDASFRRYFRVQTAHETLIVMDAPPDKENCQPFIAIAQAMLGFGLNVPKILQQDLEQGFLLLSDLGSDQYLSHLNDDSVDALYSDAIDALIKLQVNGCGHESVPLYDHEKLLAEMQLFNDWFIDQNIKIELNPSQQKIISETFEWLAQMALQQPQVWVHRDYHSRNLMVCEKNNPGVLDFQDAVIGAVTYDLVSLLKDCYIAWPRERVETWVAEYQAKALAAGIRGIEDTAQLLRWFDAMGAQRHIKVLGIFSRLFYRDGKAGYLKDIPLVFDYVLDACERLPEMAEFGRFLNDVVVAKVAR